MSAAVADRMARIDPRMRARRISVRREAGRRRLQRLVEVGLVAAVAAGFVLATRTPALDVDEVRVHGAARTSAAAALEAAAIEPGEQLLDVDLRAAGARLAALDWVEEVALSRSLSGTVDITLTERAPVAMAAGPAGPILLDGAGHVVAPAAEAPDLAGALVELTGLAGELRPGDVVQGIRGELELARRLGALAPGRIASLQVMGGDLVASVAEGGRVRFGDTSRLEPKLQAAITVLGHLGPGGLREGCELDVRFPGNPVLTSCGDGPTL